MPDHVFTYENINKLLLEATGKSLGEVDVNNVFKRTISNPKITGIAGDVIEQSVLGYPADIKQAPDLKIDDVDVELKTTGLKKSKKGKYALEAKEPMSITAVSPETIVDEQFYHSNLWHKLEHILFVYYLYDSVSTVTASEYANFVIQGYQFYEFSNQDIAIIKSDWTIVRDFIKNLQITLSYPEKEYPEISHLRNQLIYMDTAPKWPNRPRFRLKRNFITTIAQEKFGIDYVPLTKENSFTSFSEFDVILDKFTKENKNKSIEEIANNLNIKFKDKNGKVSKSISEKLTIKAFGADTSKLRNIEVFAKMGIIPKTMVITSNGARTEDTKFDTIDFNEWTDKSINFEDSYIYNYFANQTMLFIIFQEPYKDSPLEKNIFRGFKRLNFDDEFINSDVRAVWNEIRNLVWNNTLKVTEMRDKAGEYIITPKTGLIKEEVNFPKSRDHNIFLRGTGSDATDKKLKLNGFKMYNQQFWIKGTVLVQLLERTSFI